MEDRAAVNEARAVIGKLNEILLVADDLAFRLGGAATDGLKKASANLGGLDTARLLDQAHELLRAQRDLYQMARRPLDADEASDRMAELRRLANRAHASEVTP